MTVTRGSIDTRMFNAINEKTKQIWFQTSDSPANEQGIHLAGGIPNTSFSTSTPTTWGFNTFIENGGLKLRYNQIDLTTLSTNALTFYKPNVTSQVISGSTKAMELGTNALTFYSPNSTNNDLKKLMELTSGSLNFYGENDSNNPIAQYNGNGVLLGKESTGNVLIEPGGVYIREGVNVNAEFSPAKLIIGDYTYSRNIYNSQFVLDNSTGDSMITCRYWDSTNQQFNQGKSFMYWNGNRGQTLEFISYDFDSTNNEYDGSLVIGQDDYGDVTTKGIEIQSYKYVSNTSYSGIELKLDPQSIKVRSIGTTSGGNKKRTDVTEIDTSGNINTAGNLTLANHSSSIGSVYEHTASDVSLTSTAAQTQSTGKTILSCTGNNIIPAGCWVGYIYVNFSAGASSVVGFTMSTSNTSATWSTQMHASEQNYGTRIRQPAIITIANDTAYYIRAWSKEGCTVNTVTVRLMRIR